MPLMTQERLFIRLISTDHVNSDQVEYVVTTADNVIVQEPTDGSLHNAALLAESRLVVILIPSADVLLTQVKLPALRRARLIQAIPALLEEQLTQDIQELHFAIGSLEPDGVCAVAIVKHELMREWLTTLTEVGITPVLMLPEVLVLPFDDEKKCWTVLFENSKNNHQDGNDANSICIYVRTGVASGFSTELNHFLPLMKRTLSEAVDKPQSMNWIVCGDVKIPDATRVAVELDIKIDTQLILQGNLLTQCALGFTPKIGINLLSNEYRQHRHHIGARKQWHKVAVMAAVFFAVILVGNVSQYSYLSHQEKQLQAQISSLYQEAFPEATDVVSPRLRLEQMLTQLQGDNAFINIIGQVGDALSPSADLHVRELHFQHRQLRVVIEVTDAKVLEQIIHTLKARGLVASSDHAARKGRILQADLTIEQNTHE